MAFVPAAFGVKADYNYVSSLNVHKPDFDPELTTRYGSMYLTELMGMLGRKTPVSSLEFNHFEEDWIMPKINATTPGAAAGVAATFTLVSSSYSFGQASPHAGTVTTSGVSVRLNDVILIRPGSGTTSASTYIRAFVDGVTSTTFTATPFDSADAIPAIATAQEIIIIGNAFGEGSLQPVGRNSKLIQYTNNVQIIKENYKISNSEKDVVTWVKFKDDKTGREGYVWTLKGEGDTYKRFLNYRELQLLLGKKLNNNNISNPQATAGTPMATTEGLIPFILTNGTITNYSSITGWTLADGEAMVKTLDKNKGSKANWLYAGIDLSLGIDRELRNTVQNGAVSYGSGSFTEDMAINLQFSKFKLGEYSFFKKTYDVFNDNQTLGAVGYTFQSEGMVIPTDMQMDRKSREMIPSLRLRYLASPTGNAEDSRDIKHEAVDLFKLTGEDAYECRYLTEAAFEGFAGNRYHYIKQA